MDMLSAAAADGRLTLGEHADRVERAHTARTLGELASLTADLAAPSAQPIRLDTRKAVAGIFGADRRDGRWVVPATLPVAAVCGEVVIDLRDAILQSQRIMLYATVICGQLQLIVPEGVTVQMTGTAVLGRRINRGSRAAAPGLPVVEVRTFMLGGSVRVISPRKPRWRRVLGRGQR
jgi:Domain of unknown function (DUF1707)/Cell wall-active antibiotics response 4TMS YvqF